VRFLADESVDRQIVERFTNSCCFSPPTRTLASWSSVSVGRPAASSSSVWLGFPRM